MCLAVPGKVLEIDRTATPVMGNVSFGGVQKQVCLEWLPGRWPARRSSGRLYWRPSRCRRNGSRRTWYAAARDCRGSS